jgi:hypothetical protein
MGVLMHNLLTVAAADDWQQLRRRNLTTVLDPTMLHTADLFFTGGADLGPARRDQVWQRIDENAGALMTFVDAVLLWDELPVFSATPVFAQRRLLGREPLADVFRPVLVTGDEHRACRAGAQAETTRARASPELAGALLFDAYAQRLSTDGRVPVQAQRILQPERSRQLARTATGAAPGTGDEALFATMARRVGGVARFPAAPTFLPLLLQEDDILTPGHLADRLMVWRTTSAVRDYRAWLRRLRAALTTGPVPGGLASELAALARTCGDGQSPHVALEAVALPAAAVTAAGSRPVGFVRQHLGGGCHQKLMFREVPASGRLELSARLRRLWHNG